MPKNFLEDGTPTLTKEEFMAAMLIPRGYVKDKNGDWVLLHKKEEKAHKETKPTAKKSKDALKKKVSLTEKSGLTKEIIIENVKGVLEQKYNLTIDSGSIFTVSGNDTYELKFTRKSREFEFDETPVTVKDTNKKQFVRLLKTLSFCNVGVVDSGKGIVGFTDGKTFFTVTITKKRT